MKLRTNPTLKKALEGANETTAKLSVREATMSKDQTSPTRIGNTRVANQAKGQVKRKPRQNERRKGCEGGKNCASKRVERNPLAVVKRKRLCQRQWSPPQMRVMMKSLKLWQVQTRIVKVVRMLRPELLSVDALLPPVHPWMVHNDQLDLEALLDQSLDQGLDQGQNPAQGHVRGQVHLLTPEDLNQDHLLLDLDQVHLLGLDQVHLLGLDQAHLLGLDQVHLLLQNQGPLLVRARDLALLPDPVRLRQLPINPKIKSTVDE